MKDKKETKTSINELPPIEEISVVSLPYNENSIMPTPVDNSLTSVPLPPDDTSNNDNEIEINVEEVPTIKVESVPEIKIEEIKEEQSIKTETVPEVKKEEIVVKPEAKETKPQVVETTQVKTETATEVKKEETVVKENNQSLVETTPVTLQEIPNKIETNEKAEINVPEENVVPMAEQEQNTEAKTKNPNRVSAKKSLLNFESENRIDSETIISYARYNGERIMNNKYNIPAFLFNSYYCFYRKQYVLGLVCSVINNIVIAIMITKAFSTYINEEVVSINFTAIIIVSLIYGLLFNKFYLKKARSTIKNIRYHNPNMTLDELKLECAKKGGANDFNILRAILMNLVLFVFFFYMIIVPNVRKQLDKREQSIADLLLIDESVLNNEDSYYDDSESNNIEEENNNDNNNNVIENSGTVEWTIDNDSEYTVEFDNQEELFDILNDF